MSFGYTSINRFLLYLGFSFFPVHVSYKNSSLMMNIRTEHPFCVLTDIITETLKYIHINKVRI